MRQVMGPEASEREVRRAAREVFRNAARYYADLLHIPRLDAAKFLHEQLDLEGLEYLTKAREAGRGVVLVSAHFGSPEMAVQGLSAAGFTIFGLTEPREKRMSKFLTWLRSYNGHEYREVGFGGVKEAVRRLKHGGIVAIFFDRDVGGTGVPMRFCGAETSIPLGAIDLALRTGADLIPAWAWRIEGYRFHARIGPPMELTRTGDMDKDVRMNAERLLSLFEGHLRAYPGQWAVLEPIWKKQQRTPVA
jgi:KDO2-lipid IV(A) lauroyltransferase